MVFYWKLKHSFLFETTLKDYHSILSLYNRSSDLNEKYLREINDSKQHIISLEQKLVKLEEERDTMQLAAGWPKDV